MHLLKKAAKAVGVSALLGVDVSGGDVQGPSAAGSPEHEDVLFECAKRLPTSRRHIVCTLRWQSALLAITT